MANLQQRARAHVLEPPPSREVEDVVDAANKCRLVVTGAAPNRRFDLYLNTEI
jgi:hypothetical protein